MLLTGTLRSSLEPNEVIDNFFLELADTKKSSNLVVGTPKSSIR